VSFPFSASLDLPSFAGPSDAPTNNQVSFTDGSFTTAATPTPGLTAGLENTSSAVASIGTAVSTLSDSTTGILALLAVGTAVWLWIRQRV
jgi:hypothetical protein